MDPDELQEQSLDQATPQADDSLGDVAGSTTATLPPPVAAATTDKWADAPVETASSLAPTSAAPGNTTSPSTPAVDPKWAGSPAAPSDFQTAYKTVADSDPDKNAQALTLSRQLGQAPASVAADLPEAQKAAQKPTDQQLTDLETQHPDVAKFFADHPEVLAAAHDDLPNLAQHSSLIQRFAMAAGAWAELRGVGGIGDPISPWFESLPPLQKLPQPLAAFDASLNQVDAGIARFPSLVQTIGGLPINLARKAMGLPQVDFAAQLPDWLGNNNPVAGYYAKNAQAYQAQVTNNQSDLHAAITQGDFPKAGSIVANSLAGFIPQFAAFAADPALGAGLMAEGQGSEALSQAQDKGASPVQAGSEAVINTAAGYFLGKAGTGTIVKDLASKITAQYGAQTAKQVVAETLGTLLKDVSLGTGQSVAGVGTSDIADYVTGLNPKAFDNWQSRYASAAEVGGFLGLGMAVPGLSIAHLNNRMDAAHAEVSKQFLSDLTETAQQSKLLERSPEDHADFVKGISQGQDPIIPMDAIQQHFQSQKIDPLQWAQENGISEAYKEAMETGSLKIPLSTWTDKIGVSDVGKALQDDVKFDPGDKTVNEAKAMDTDIQGKIKEAVATAEKQKTAEKANDDAMAKAAADNKASIADQLAGIGDRKSKAQVFTKILSNLGERSGVGKAIFDRFKYLFPKGEDAYVPPQKEMETQAWEQSPHGLMNRLGKKLYIPKENKADTKDFKELGTPVTSEKGDGHLAPADLAEFLKNHYVAQGLHEHPFLHQLKAESEMGHPVDAEYDQLKDYLRDFSGKNKKEYLENIEKPETQGFNQDARETPAGDLSGLESLIERHDGESEGDYQKRLKEADRRVNAREAKGQRQVDYKRGLPSDAEAVMPSQEDLENPNKRASLPESAEIKHAWAETAKLEKELMKNTDPAVLAQRAHEIAAGKEIIDPATGKSYTVHARGILNENRTPLLQLGSGIHSESVLPQDDSSHIGEGATSREGESPSAESRARHAAAPPRLSQENPSFKTRMGRFAADAETYYQDPTAGGSPRGRIEISKTVMGRLFKIFTGEGKDESTVLHELGHSILYILHDLATDPKANDEIKGLYADALKELGVEKFADLTPAHHEKFARSFEQYLRTGEVPGEGMRGIYRQIRDWLVKVYRNSKELNAVVSPGLKSVFDRIVASQDEIDRAEHESGIFKTPLPGSTPAVRARVEALQKEAHDRAVDDLLHLQMQETTKEHLEEVQKERERLTDEATRIVDGSPLFSASKTIEDKFGPGEGAAGLADKFLANKATLEESAALEAAAAGHGFTSSGALAQALSDAEAYGTRRTQIDQLVDAGMQKHADLMDSPDRMRAEAVKAIYADGNKMGELLALESQHMAQLMKSDKALSAAKSQANRQTAAIKAKSASDHAAAILATKPYPEASNARTFIAQERNQAIRQAKALASGHADVAADAGEKRLLNHMLANQALKIAAQTRKDLQFIKKFRQHQDTPELAKRRDIDLVNAGRSILAAHGVGDPDGTNPLDHLDKLKDVSTDAETYLNLKEAVEKLGLINGHLGSMKYSDFQEVIKTLRALWSVSSRIKQAEINGKLVFIQDIVDKLNAQNTANQKFSKAKMGPAHAPTDWEKMKIDLLEAEASFGIVDSWADLQDGDSKERPYSTYFVRTIHTAANAMRAERNAIHEDVLKILNPMKDKINTDPIYSPDLDYTFKGTQEIMGTMQHTGTDSSFQKLLRGKQKGDGSPWGDWVRDEIGQTRLDENGKKILDTSKWDAAMKKFHDDGTIGKEHWDAVQKIWDSHEDIKPRVQAVKKEMEGFEFEELDPRAIKTPFGDYKGGYMPASVDPYQNTDAKLRAAKAALENQDSEYRFPTAGKGATMKRVEAYAAPLKCDIRLTMHHLDWALRYIHLEPRVRELGRVVQNKEFGESIKRINPAAQNSLLMPWLQRSVRQTTVVPGGNALFDNACIALKKNVSIAYLAGNVADALSRAMSIPLAALKIKPTHMAKALVTYSTNPLKMAAANQAESKFMLGRQHSIANFDTNKAVDEIVLNPGGYAKAQVFAENNAMVVQLLMHHMMDHVTYTAAKNEALTPKENGGMGMSLPDAIYHAEDMVKKTQGSNNPEDVSSIQTGTPFMGLFKTFFGFFNRQYNFLKTEIVKAARNQVEDTFLNSTLAKFGIPKRYARGLYVLGMGGLITSIYWQTVHNILGGYGVIGASKKDEDDDQSDTTGDYLNWLLGSPLKQSLQAVPSGGAIINFGSELAGQEHGSNTSSAFPILDGLDTIAHNAQNIYRLAQGKGSTRKTVRDALTSAAIVGVPFAGMVSRPASYAAGLMNDEYQPSDALDMVRGIISGSPGKK